MYRAPLGKILLSFIPVVLEKGVPGYEGAKISVPGEKRLSRMEIRSLLAASAYLGVEEHAGNQNFDSERVRQILTRSLLELNELSPDEKTFSLRLVDCFYSYKFIRANHSFDDWVCEALWSQFQSIQYVYPSAMAEAVAYGLTINQSLGKCSLEC